MRVGFTGTRIELTFKQVDALDGVLAAVEGPAELHHGDCVGADAWAARRAAAFRYRVVSHPPTENGYRAWIPATEMREPKPYLERNRAIVDETERLIAVPDGPERVRSGTWSTVRYARRLGRSITIIWPDGRVESTP